MLVGGFGLAGQPLALIDAVRRSGKQRLTIVKNNAGNGDTGLAALLATGQVGRIICSFPRQRDSWVFDGLYRSGEIELEVVPQGNLAERLRAAGAGIGAFYTPTGVGTALAADKERRWIQRVSPRVPCPVPIPQESAGLFAGSCGSLVLADQSPEDLPSTD